VRTPDPPDVPVLRLRAGGAAALAGASAVGLLAFGWPFVVDAGSGLAHSADAPWLFAVLVALLAAVVAAQLGAGGLDPKAVALLGVLAAAGGALRVLSAGTAGLEPVFFLIIVGGFVLGPAAGYLLGALALLVGALLTGGVGPWLPFQMTAAGWVGLGAAFVPALGAGRRGLAALAAYGFVAGLVYGAVMNLWFWPVSTRGLPEAVTFVPGDAAADNLVRYARFYLATSLAWDLPRAVLTAVLTVVGGPAVVATLRRAVRRAAFAEPAR
jgi:energy-coupling factor transport system substrate-specific component